MQSTKLTAVNVAAHDACWPAVIGGHGLCRGRLMMTIPWRPVWSWLWRWPPAQALAPEMQSCRRVCWARLQSAWRCGPPLASVPHALCNQAIFPDCQRMQDQRCHTQGCVKTHLPGRAHVLHSGDSNWHCPTVRSNACLLPWSQGHAPKHKELLMPTLLLLSACLDHPLRAECIAGVVVTISSPLRCPDTASCASGACTIQQCPLHIVYVLSKWQC